MARNIKTAEGRRSGGVTLGVTLSATALALTACGKSSAAKSSGETPASVSTPATSSIVFVGKSALLRVCDGFFTQQQPDGTIEVVGRPAVDKTNYPLDVETQREGGIQAEPKTHEPGIITWYDIRGQWVSSVDKLPCNDITVHSTELDQPNGQPPIWVATSSEQPAPPHWDALALNPAHFGGVALDYGPMPQQGLQDTLKLAGQNSAS